MKKLKLSELMLNLLLLLKRLKEFVRKKKLELLQKKWLKTLKSSLIRNKQDVKKPKLKLMQSPLNKHKKPQMLKLPELQPMMTKLIWMPKLQLIKL